MSTTAGCSVSCIIPAYNEEQRIAATLQAAIAYFAAQHFSAEILVVDDGSTDATAAICLHRAAAHSAIRVLRLPANRGKGRAVQQGILAAHGEYILYADADGATPIDEFDKFLPLLAPNRLLAGSRLIDPALIERRQSRYRVWLSRLANWLIRLWLVENVRDTQCGFKVLHRSLARRLAHRQRIFRFGFDVEYLALAQRWGYEIVEVPVRWRHSPQSRLRPIRDGLHTFFDLLRLVLRLRH